MTVNKLRALARTLLLGTTLIGAGAVLTALPSAALTVSAEVGKALQEAQSLMTQGNYRAAMAKANEAEAAHKTADEAKVIAAMKESIAIKSGDASVGGALGAKAKFANDYNARKYSDVIADADALRKTGSLDNQSMQIVAQAYYLSGNKVGCVKYIKSSFGTGGSEDTLQLLMRCAYDAGDEDTQRAALEQLVSRTGKSEYWSSLLKLAGNARGLADHQTLDIYRIKLLTGTLAGKDEYTLLAQIALQLGFPAEAQAVIEKGMTANLLNDDRSKRLLNLAKQQAAAAVAGKAAARAAADKDPQGDALIKIAESDWGSGDYKAAIDTAQTGLQKSVKDKANAQTVLGMAYVGAGQKDLAVKSFNEVKGAGNGPMVSHLWALYAQNGQGMKAAAPSAKAARKKR